MATPRPQKKSSLRSVRYRQNSFGGFEALDLDLPGPHINRDFLERRSVVESDDGTSRRTTNYSRGADSILEEDERVGTVPTGTGVLTTRNRAHRGPRTTLNTGNQNGAAQRIAEWKIKWWKSPLIALITLIIGAGTAVGHHFYFSHLDGTEYRPAAAIWTQRYSLVLAFVVKVSLVATIQFTYFQVVWSSLKMSARGISLNGLDALFDVLSRSLSFLVIDMWKGAPLAVIIAIAIWILPLVSFVTPTTLTVVVSAMGGSTDCTVPTLDFRQGLDQVNGNQTRERQSQDLSRYTFTGLYQGPSALATKIGTLAAYDGSPLSFDSPCGLNCSYINTFYAPAWRCNRTTPMELNAPWQNYADDPLEGYIPWFPSEQVDPNEDTANRSSNWDTAYTYVTWTDEDSGFFWLGHSTPKYGKSPDSWPEGSGNNTYLELFDVEQFYCGSWNARYTIDVEFENGSRKKLSVSKLEYLNNVTTSRRELGDVSKFDSEVGYARAAHIAMFEVLGGLLNGTIKMDPGGMDIFSRDLKIPSIPALIEDGKTNEDSNNATATEQSSQEPFQVRKSIQQTVEELSQNYTLSLLSQKQLQFLRYDTPDAANTGDGVCASTNVRQQWEYHPRELIIAYSVAVGAALLALLLGYLIILKHGVVMGSNFSAILLTTRNRELDELARGNCLGSEDVKPKDVGKMKLRFGEVVPPGESGAPGHTAFGPVETTQRIRKGERYS